MTSGVEKVCFDSDEAVVAAGSASGTVKLFDLQNGKSTGQALAVPFIVYIVRGIACSHGRFLFWGLFAATRTLTGHKSNIRALSFHPYTTEFLASGSLDTSLKVWDVKRKGCIQTYKGHTQEINCVKFSPDGRWVVSGGEDGIVKVGTARNFSMYVILTTQEGWLVVGFDGRQDDQRVYPAHGAHHRH
jgi:katanin p80 WD40 repeat-containing subunit B1